MKLWVGLFALAVGAVLSIPHVLMPIQRRFYQKNFPEYFNSWPNNGSFSAIESFYMDTDAFPYAARIHQAGTHLLPGDPHIKENHSGRLIVRDFITISAFGLLYRLVGSISATWVLAQFLLCVLWVPCLYLLLLALDLEPAAALFGAVGYTLFEDLTRLPMGPPLAEIAKSAAHYLLWPLGSYLYWFGPTRFTRPLFTYPWLFLAAVLAIRAEKSRTWSAAAACGVVGGLLIYVHPDVWGAFMGAMGLFTLYVCWREKRLVPQLWAVLGIAAALSAVGVLAVRPASGGEISVIMPSPRHVNLKSILYLSIAALAWWRLRANKMAVWCVGLLVTISLALNASLMTGFQGASTSLWWYLGNTFGALLLLTLLLRQARFQPATWRWLSLTALLLAIPRATDYSILHYQLYAMPRAQEEALAWLNANTPEDSVVAALNPMANMRVATYTHDKTLTSMIFPLTSNISVQENARRLVEDLKLFGVTPKRFVDVGMAPSADWGRRLWTGQVDVDEHDRSAMLRYFLWLEDPVEFLSNLTAAERDPGRKDYEADFLWVGPYERSLMDKNGLPGPLGKAKPVFSNASVSIYRL
jgi:hypothetical protein